MPRSQFDRAEAYGKRLDIPAGTAVRFEPGETKTVSLVEIAGKQSHSRAETISPAGQFPTQDRDAALATCQGNKFRHIRQE